jgi:hypothetical protein
MENIINIDNSPSVYSSNCSNDDTPSLQQEVRKRAKRLEWNEVRKFVDK